MRLLIIASSVIPSASANSIQVLRMCRAFARNGAAVQLVVPYRRGHHVRGVHMPTWYGLDGAVALRQLPFWRRCDYGLFFSLISALQARKNHPDMVYARALMAACIAAHLGIPVVVELHSDPLQEHWTLRAAWHRLLAHRNLRGIVCITQSLVDQLRRAHPGLQTPLLVAADAADSGPLPRTRQLGQRLQVVYSGSSLPGKGLDLVAAIAKDWSAGDIHIIGADKDHPALHHLPDRVQIHGRVSPGSVGKHLGRMDVALLPNQTQVVTAGGTDIGTTTSPLKLFEYWGAGCAVLASDLPVLREVLSHHENALLCPADDPQAWIAALDRLDQDEALRYGLASRGHECCRERFNWDQRARSIMAWLAQLGSSAP